MSDTSHSTVLALGRPMPRADPAWVRVVAGRLAGVAGEWNRVRGVLAGRVGDGTGWAGCAELTFAESVAGEMARLSLVVKRFDGYAAALMAYAGELEVLGPRLAAARARAEGQPGDVLLAADFDRCWREWDAARGRCVARLRAAGAGAGLGHRHWWSGLAGAVSGVVRHGAELRTWSRVLAELGQGLVVAGLVCALLCPPLAGAVWAAVAVVAVCQLAVDAARRERGEPVGWGGLGWDVAGALPAGRAARELRAAADAVTEWRSAAEASAAIERLPESVRSSPLVPGGGLEAHEGTETVRGHTLRKHVNKTPRQLAKRFRADPDLRWSSSFTDRYTAEAAISQALGQNGHKIARWNASNADTLIIDADVGCEIGSSLSVNGIMVRTPKLRVVLRKESSVLGYYIKTAFPTP
jgi:hypothetical protein